MQATTASLAIVGALLACACTSEPVRQPGFSGYSSYDDCFFANAMTDWRPLDSMNLVVFTGVRRSYHIQLATRSPSLRFEDSIAFVDRDGRICPYGGDAIVINGSMPDRISIASIRRLSESQLEDLYRSYNIAVPGIIDAPELAQEEE